MKRITILFVVLLACGKNEPPRTTMSFQVQVSLLDDTVKSMSENFILLAPKGWIKVNDLADSSLVEKFRSLLESTSTLEVRYDVQQESLLYARSTDAQELKLLALAAKADRAEQKQFWLNGKAVTHFAVRQKEVQSLQFFIGDTFTEPTVEIIYLIKRKNFEEEIQKVESSIGTLRPYNSQ